jgi:DNA oxidative demethylase
VPSKLPHLFDDRRPDGLRYVEDFLAAEEEAALLERFGRLEFRDMTMRGVKARRRVIQYGWHYSFESFTMTEAAPIPDFLLPIRDRAAVVAGLEAGQLSEGLILEYPPGATIGWHRDAAPFGTVVGISLGAACRFRFRRGRTREWETFELDLQPRSLYVLDGAARRAWEHGIPAVKALRYSITFRTLRRKA